MVKRVTKPSAVLAEITDASGTFSDEVVIRHIFIHHLVVYTGSHVSNLIIDLFILPNGLLSSCFHRSCFMEINTVNSELDERIHLAEQFSVACQVSIANFEVKDAEDFRCMLS